MNYEYLARAIMWFIPQKTIKQAVDQFNYLMKPKPKPNRSN